MDNDIKAAAYAILSADSTLLDLLAENKPAYNTNASPSKAASIVDYLKAGDMKPVFLTLRAGDSNLAGRTHLTHAFLLIRCYNKRDKSFFTINQALSRVQKLLDGKRFPVSGYGTVGVVWETTRAELLDEGLDMNFREAQFRIELT